MTKVEYRKGKVYRDALLNDECSFYCDKNLTKILDSGPLCHSGLLDPVKRATDRCLSRSVLGWAEEGILYEERNIARKRPLEVAHQLFHVTTSVIKVTNYLIYVSNKLDHFIVNINL
jgi:hypothetical protein